MFNKKENEKDTLKILFSKYIPDINCFESQEIQNKPLRVKEIAYILLSIKEDEEQIQNISDAVMFLESNGVMVDTIETVFIKGSIGALNFDDNINKNEEINKVIKNLISSNVKYQSCIYGIDTCKVGTIGSNKRMSYTVIIPNYKSKLLKLLSLDSKKPESV